jgi:hypothetical protein
MNNITKASPKNITIELGKSHNNTHFLLLIKENGAVYDYNGYTNSTGSSSISLNYAGNYTLTAYTLFYNSSSVKYNTVHGTGHIKFNMTQRTSYNSTIMLKSAEPLSGNASVNESTLSGHGGAFNIAASGIVRNSTGTYYTYQLPSGMYSFYYNNASFASKNFNMNVTGNMHINETLYAYLVSVNITDNTGIKYSYNLSYSGGIASNTANGTYHVTSGIDHLHVDIGGRLVYSKNISINRSNPYYKISLNLVNNNFTLNGSAFYSSGNLKVTYSGTVTKNIVMTGMHFENLSTSNNMANITISDNSVNNMYPNITLTNYQYNLTNPLSVSSGNLAIKLSINNTSFSGSQSMNVLLTSYGITQSGSYVKE